jgi:hypothetical protein
LLRHVRERIEGVFHRLQNTGRIWNACWLKPCMVYPLVLLLK